MAKVFKKIVKAIESPFKPSKSTPVTAAPVLKPNEQEALISQATTPVSGTYLAQNTGQQNKNYVPINAIDSAALSSAINNQVAFNSINPATSQFTGQLPGAINQQVAFAPINPATSQFINPLTGAISQQTNFNAINPISSVYQTSLQDALLGGAAQPLSPAQQQLLTNVGDQVSARLARVGLGESPVGGNAYASALAPTLADIQQQNVTNLQTALNADISQQQAQQQAAAGQQVNQFGQNQANVANLTNLVNTDIARQQNAQNLGLQQNQLQLQQNQNKTNNLLNAAQQDINAQQNAQNLGLQQNQLQLQQNQNKVSNLQNQLGLQSNINQGVSSAELGQQANLGNVLLGGSKPTPLGQKSTGASPFSIGIQAGPVSVGVGK